MSFEPLQDKLGYRFRDPELLREALTHSSHAHENGTAVFNERLEFLGDAVLELTVSHWLFAQNPDMPEGLLTKTRASLVCEPSLAALARSVSLGGYLLLGRGEHRAGGRMRDSLLSDALEAVLGAVYLDGGFDAARDMILRLYEAVPAEAPMTDYKTNLQEILQKDGGETAAYAIVHESGPSHAREFTATVSHAGCELGAGTGRSKKEAEQNAARAALDALDRTTPA